MRQIHLIDLSNPQHPALSWSLPKLDSDFPLTAHLDQDKLLVCYDSNKFQFFDLL